MDFALSEDQEMFREAVRRFAKEKLSDSVVARAQDERFPWDVARAMADQGLFGILLSETDGGQGGTLMDAVLAMEEIAAVCPRSADVIQAGNFGAIRTFAEFASREQKDAYLPDLLTGRRVIAVAMTEPEAGSAVTSLKTEARPDGSGFRINGTKVFTTHSSDAHVFLVYVRFGPGTSGIGSVLVERGDAGFQLGEPSRFMSGDTWRQLYFDNVYVPAERVLLPAGGFKKQISGFNVERVGNATRALALGRHAFAVARDHAGQAPAVRQLLCEFQGIQWKFAEMAMKLEARVCCFIAPQPTRQVVCRLPMIRQSPRWPAIAQASMRQTNRSRAWGDWVSTTAASCSTASGGRAGG